MDERRSDRPEREPTLPSDAFWVADEPPPAIRDAPPDPLAPIDPNAPVSGHVPPPEPKVSVAELSAHDWAAAEPHLYPLLRPVGTIGIELATIEPAALAAEGLKPHAQQLVDPGPVGLAVVYAIASEGFDVIVNAGHLLSWGVGPAEVRTAAFRNLAAWSATAGWTAEESGARRLLSSDTGDGWDASRILLPEVRALIAREVGATGGRVLVGLPERHLLVAGSLMPDDPEFARLFGEFVLEHSGGADEPIDRRVFELVGGELVPFTG